MIWAWPFVWVAILVFGIVGLLQILLGFGLVVWEARELINDIFDRDWNCKWRRRWLVEHFGEAGADRWMLNKQSAALYLRADPCIRQRNGTNWFGDMVLRDSVSAYKKLQRMHGRYPWLAGEVRRGNSGQMLGTVVMNWGGQRGHNSWFPPWGEDHKPYPARHGMEGQFEAFQPVDAEAKWYHGEPRWHDWMAAGEYDRGRALLTQDCITARLNGTASMLSDIPGASSLTTFEKKVIWEEARLTVKSIRALQR